MSVAAHSTGVLRFALACALVLMGMALVIRRQSQALELVRAVEKARAEQAVVEAERAQLVRRIDRLESRDRIAAVASRLGMRLPGGDQIVILPDGGPRSGAAPGAALVLR